MEEIKKEEMNEDNYCDRCRDRFGKLTKIKSYGMCESCTDFFDWYGEHYR